MPRPLIGLLWVVAVLGVLLLAAWAALAIFFPPAKVKEMVSARLQRAMDREVRFDDASIGLFPPVRLTVAGLAIAEPEGFERGAALSAESVHLDLDVFALLQKRVVVRKLIIDEPSVHLLLRENGTTNFDGFAPPPVAGTEEGAAREQAASSGGLALAINRLELRDARILIDDVPADRRSMFTVDSRFALEGRPDGRVALDGATTISDVAFGPLDARTAADLNRGLAGIDWRLQHKGVFDAASNRVAFERLALQLGRAEVAFVGRVDEPGAKARFDLRAQGSNVDLGEVFRILAAADARMLNGLEGEGDMAFDIQVQGAASPGKLPTISGQLSISRGAFRYPDAPASIRDLAFTARLGPDTLRIPSLTANVVSGSGTSPVRAALFATRFDDPLVRFSVQGDLDLAAVAPILAPEGVGLGGHAVVDVQGSGPAKEPAAMRMNGSAELRDVSLTTPDLEKPIEKVNGTVAFSNTRAEVRNLSATAGASSFTMNATVERPFALGARPGTPEAEETPPAAVTFQLGSPYMDLGELLPPTPGAAVLPNAVGDGRIVIEHLKRGRLDVKNVNATLAIEPGIVNAKKFDLRGYGGSVEGTAKFDLREAQPRYELSAHVIGVEANDLLSTWTPVRDLVHGSLTTNLELSGQGTDPKVVAETITAVGLAAIRNGAVGPTPVLEALSSFTKMPAFKEIQVRDGSIPFAVEEGRVSFRDVQLAGRTGEWRLAGSVGFDGTLDYAVSTTVPRELATRLGSAGTLVAGALRDDKGDILIDLRVYGDMKSPKIAWDKKAMLDRLMGRSSSALTTKSQNLGEKALESLGGAGMTPDTSLADYEKRVRAIADSLKKLKAKDVIKSLFGSEKDTIW